MDRKMTHEEQLIAQLKQQVAELKAEAKLKAQLTAEALKAEAEKQQQIQSLWSSHSLLIDDTTDNDNTTAKLKRKVKNTNEHTDIHTAQTTHEPILEHDEQIKYIADTDNNFGITSHGRLWDYKRGEWSERNVRGNFTSITRYNYYRRKQNLSYIAINATTLVLRYFVPNPHNYKHCKYKDDNACNRRADNLEWARYHPARASQDNLFKHAQYKKHKFRLSDPILNNAQYNEAMLRGHITTYCDDVFDDYLDD